MTGAGDHSLRGLVAGTKYVKNTPHCVAQRSCFLICWDSIERKLQAASSLSQALKFWVATRRRDAHFHHIVQHSLPLQHHEPYSSGTMSAAAKGEPVCHLVYVRFKAHGQVLRLNMYYVTVPICEMYMFSGRYVNAGITRPEISCIVPGMYSITIFPSSTLWYGTSHAYRRGHHRYRMYNHDNLIQAAKLYSAHVCAG